MTTDLPEWYPIANATDDEIDAWLVAAIPPYDEMREALPWLNQEYQFNAWIEGLRDARARADSLSILRNLFPNIAKLPLPPRRLAGRVAR